MQIMFKQIYWNNLGLELDACQDKSNLSLSSFICCEETSEGA